MKIKDDEKHKTKRKARNEQKQLNDEKKVAARMETEKLPNCTGSNTGGEAIQFKKVSQVNKRKLQLLFQIQSTFKQTIILLISSWNQTKKTQTTNKRPFCKN